MEFTHDPGTTIIERAITKSNSLTFFKYTKHYLEHYGYYNWTDISFPL